MVKYQMEFKIVVANEFGVETRHIKRTFENIDEVLNNVQSSLTNGLEFLSVRKVAEPKLKPIKKEVKPNV